LDAASLLAGTPVVADGPCVDQSVHLASAVGVQTDELLGAVERAEHPILHEALRAGLADGAIQTVNVEQNPEVRHKVDGTPLVGERARRSDTSRVRRTKRVDFR